MNKFSAESIGQARRKNVQEILKGQTPSVPGGPPAGKEHLQARVIIDKNGHRKTVYVGHKEEQKVDKGSKGKLDQGTEKKGSKESSGKVGHTLKGKDGTVGTIVHSDEDGHIVEYTQDGQEMHSNLSHDKFEEGKKNGVFEHIGDDGSPFEEESSKETEETSSKHESKGGEVKEEETQKISQTDIDAVRKDPTKVPKKYQENIDKGLPWNSVEGKSGQERSDYYDEAKEYESETYFHFMRIHNSYSGKPYKEREEALFKAEQWTCSHYPKNKKWEGITATRNPFVEMVRIVGLRGDSMEIEFHPKDRNPDVDWVENKRTDGSRSFLKLVKEELVKKDLPYSARLVDGTSIRLTKLKKE